MTQWLISINKESLAITHLLKLSNWKRNTYLIFLLFGKFFDKCNRTSKWFLMAFLIRMKLFQELVIQLQRRGLSRAKQSFAFNNLGFPSLFLKRMVLLMSHCVVELIFCWIRLLCQMKTKRINTRNDKKDERHTRELRLHPPPPSHHTFVVFIHTPPITWMKFQLSYLWKYLWTLSRFTDSANKVKRDSTAALQSSRPKVISPEVISGYVARYFFLSVNKHFIDFPTFNHWNYKHFLGNLQLWSKLFVSFRFVSPN